MVLKFRINILPKQLRDYDEDLIDENVTNKKYGKFYPDITFLKFYLFFSCDCYLIKFDI